MKIFLLSYLNYLFLVALSLLSLSDTSTQSLPDLCFPSVIARLDRTIYGSSGQAGR